MSAFSLFRRRMRMPAQTRERAPIEYLPQEYPAVEAAVLGALRDGAERVVLDLDTIVALDTDTLRRLISLLRRARSRGREVALRSSREEVLRTLSVTGLDRVFAVLRSHETFSGR